MPIEETQNRLIIRNGDQSATFVTDGDSYRPEWFRDGDRPMLRFKDHEWLNISAVRVTRGALRASSEMTRSGVAALARAISSSL